MRIGITIGLGDTQLKINRAYVKYVAGAGFEPVLISPENDLEAMADICDGLLLPGGIDIDPMHYGEENVGSYHIDPEKDMFERQALQMFGAMHEKPVFGICRGFQLIIREFLQENPKFGKKVAFWQHVESHGLASSLDAPRTTPTHYVDGCRKVLYGDDGEDYPAEGFSMIPVNSMHHQALIGPAPIAAHIVAEQDKTFQRLAWTSRGIPTKAKGVIIEAFRIRNWCGGKIEAVQWHPEELKDYALIRHFFNQFAGADLVQEA